MEILFVIVVFAIIALTLSLFRGNYVSELRSLYTKLDPNDSEFNRAIDFTMDYCNNLFGVSHPTLIYDKITHPDDRAGEYNFEDHSITIDSEKFNGFTVFHIINAVIHEYQHHVDNLTYSQQYTKKQMTDNWEYFDDIFESRAEEVADKYTHDCFSKFLKSK